MAAVPADVKADQQIGEWIDGLQCRLRQKLASTEDAEDIAQEACLRLMQLPTTENIQNPRAYLYRIAHNLVYDHYRRKPLIVERIEIDRIEDPYASPEAQTIVQVRREQIARATKELPPKCQYVLALRWRDGLRVKEIADTTGLSVSMVKKYLATGLAHCRKRLALYVIAEQTAG